MLKALEAIIYDKIIPEELKTKTNEPIFISREIKISQTSRNGSILIITNSKNTQQNLNPQLINAIAKSYHWNNLLLSGKARSNKDIQKMENLSDNDNIKKALGLRILSPKIVEAILNGQQPEDLTVQKLLNVKTLDWQEQERILNFI